MSGYWTQYGPLASVDWCEPNYLISPWVAEWWNTLSSLAIFALAVWGWWQAKKLPQLPGRYAFAYLVVACVGLGSVAFHGTLLRSAQASDELPMIAAGLSYIYLLSQRNYTSEHPAQGFHSRLKYLLGTYLVGFVAAYYYFQSLFALFIISYALLVAGLVLHSGRISFFKAPVPHRKRLFGLSTFFYVGGVALLWVPEHLILPCEHSLQALQLHALFHLTSALGSYLWLTWAIYDYACLHGFQGQLSPSFPWLFLKKKNA